MLRLLASLLCVLCLPSLAAEKEAEKLEDLVKQLGDPEFKLRQAASDRLMKQVEQDPEFAKQLEPFAADPDPEIRARIAELTKDLPVVLAWMDPKQEAQTKSRTRSPEKLKLTVKNRSKQQIRIFWVDWSGKRQARGELKPGEERTIAKTYVDHYWLIADAEGKGLGLYVAKEGKDAQIIHRGKEGK